MKRFGCVSFSALIICLIWLIWLIWLISISGIFFVHAVATLRDGVNIVHLYQIALLHRVSVNENECSSFHVHLIYECVFFYRNVRKRFRLAWFGECWVSICWTTESSWRPFHSCAPIATKWCFWNTIRYTSATKTKSKEENNYQATVLSGLKIPEKFKKVCLSQNFKWQIDCNVRFFFYRGIFLACILYHEDKILVTNEDFLPVIEIDETYPSSLHADYHWLMKVCNTHTHIGRERIRTIKLILKPNLGTELIHCLMNNFRLLALGMMWKHFAQIWSEMQRRLFTFERNCWRPLVKCNQLYVSRI